MRREATDAERVLWRALRDRRLARYKIRRQYSVAGFIADFACVSARTIIEIDGGQHADNPHDERRTAVLSAEGWRVLRFWNNEVLENRQGVLEAIVLAMSAAPSPSQPSAGPLPLPPSAGEG